MGYFNFLMKIMKYFFKNKFICLFLVFIIIIFIKNSAFAVDSVNDLYTNITKEQELKQNLLVLHALPPYLNNTDYWNNVLYPEIFELISSSYWDIYVGYNNGSSSVGSQYLTFTVDFYRQNEGTNTTMNYFDNISRTSSTIDAFTISGIDTKQTVYDYSDNSGYVRLIQNRTLTIPWVIRGYKSPLMYDFIQLINGGSNNVTSILIGISNYLDNIDTVNSDILSSLNDITQALSSIPTSDYSNQIGTISGQISDILDDNDTVISQNEDMITQAEEINENLESVNDSITDIKDTITDDTVDTTTSDLPSVDVNNPTENGINNIFQLMYNAFCVGDPQDIVFPFPYTDKKIIIPVNYLRDNLINNNSTWIYNFIQAFWGYIFGVYVVLDVSSKIRKIKEGNIEDIQTTNIKEDML